MENFKVDCITFSRCPDDAGEGGDMTKPAAEYRPGPPCWTDEVIEVRFHGLPLAQGTVVTEPPAVKGWKVVASWPACFGLAMILKSEDKR